MNVVFDFGGVVFNWQPVQLMQSVLPHHAVDEDSARRVAADIFQSFRLGGDWAAFDRGEVTVPQVVERIAQRTGLSSADVLAVVQAIPPHLQPLPGTLDLMRQLKTAGHRLFYLSNMPAPYADHLEAVNDFFHWFDGGIFSARVNLIKPEPEIFQAAIQQFGIEPCHTWFIDDLAHNIDAARAQGWQGIQFHNPAQCGAELRAAALL
jgi:putative hydrolase of the HAD superfamily